MKKSINIFISSPGDVRKERYIANQVISEISNTFEEYADINCLMWEKMPLLATGTFQEGIDYITNQQHIDIAVFILWTRLGSNPGNKYLKEDGSDYSSGTEYEYDMMRASFAKSGSPKILFYVKKAPFRDAINQLESDLEINEAVKQLDALKHFMQANFPDNGVMSNNARHSFENAQEFRDLLDSHVRSLVKEAIGVQSEQIREWNGNPYVGLDSFQYEQREIFYGRTNFVSRIASDLIRVCETGKKPSMILIGESGSGKSSLVNAGLFPFLKEGFSDKETFDTVTFIPSSYSGMPYAGLVGIIKDNYPGLVGNPVIRDLEGSIEENYNFEYLEYALSHEKRESGFLLYLDQFEEIFSDTQITEEERRRFLMLLAGLVRSNSMWVIISMRNDFYSKFAAYPKLGKIRECSLFYDVPSLSISEIAQIVSEPARKAGLKFEVDDRGQNLEKIIINDAVSIRDLPLIEFGLFELYKLKDDSDTVRMEFYEKIDRLKGAIIKYADSVYAELSEEDKTIFNELLSSVITCATDNDIFVRKTALRDEIATDSNHSALIKKLVDSHIFKSGKDAKGNATITIVHEILLSSWPVISNWCSNQKDFIRMNDFYEVQAQYWRNAGKSKTKLIAEGEDLLNAEYFDYSWGRNSSPDAKEYIKASISNKRRKNIVLWCFIDFIVTLFILLVWLSPYWLTEDIIPHYPGETEAGYFYGATILLAVFYLIRGRIKKLPKRADSGKIVVFLGLSFILTTADSVLCTIYPQKDDELWMTWLPPFLLSISFFSHLLDCIPLRIWKKGIVEKSLGYNKRISQIKGIVGKSFALVGIIFCVLVISQKR